MFELVHVEAWKHQRGPKLQCHLWGKFLQFPHIYVPSSGFRLQATTEIDFLHDDLSLTWSFRASSGVPYISPL